MSNPKTLRAVDHVYPNGHACKDLMFGEQCLGSYTAEADGYLPNRKRKPCESEFDAVLYIIKARMKDAEKHLAWTESAWDAAFAQQQEFKAK